MDFLSRALHPNITTYTRHLQDLSKKEMEKINNRDNISLTEEDRIALNRQNVQSKIFILVKDILKKELNNHNNIEIISNYDKNNNIDSLFNFTVNYKNGNNLEIKYNSDTNRFLINSNFLEDKKSSDFETKLSNAMINIDTLINAAADFDNIDVRVHKDRHSVLEITPLNETVRDENDKPLYEVSQSYGIIYPENIYKKNNDLVITAIVNFHNTDTNRQDDYAVSFMNQDIKGAEINRIEKLSPFIKVNTLINIFEQSRNGLFTEIINKSKNTEDFIKNSINTTKDFLTFAKEMEEKITRKDLITYSKTKIDAMPPHGFQNIITHYTNNTNNNTNNMK